MIRIDHYIASPYWLVAAGVGLVVVAWFMFRKVRLP